MTQVCTTQRISPEQNVILYGYNFSTKMSVIDTDRYKYSVILSLINSEETTMFDISNTGDAFVWVIDSNGELMEQHEKSFAAPETHPDKLKHHIRYLFDFDHSVVELQLDNQPIMTIEFPYQQDHFEKYTIALGRYPKELDPVEAWSNGDVEYFAVSPESEDYVFLGQRKNGKTIFCQDFLRSKYSVPTVPKGQSYEWYWIIGVVLVIIILIYFLRRRS